MKMGECRDKQTIFAAILPAALAVLALASGCSVGPKYERPAVPSPTAYKELTPADLPQTDGWKVAQPSDGVLHGKWWEMFGDTELNALEERVGTSNQNVAAAAASFLEARALVKQARSQYYPTVTVNPGIASERNPVVPGANASQVKAFGDYSLPFDASWQPDLWGRVRNTVAANSAAAQSSAADLENVRLTAQAEVAVDYYQLRGQDSLKDLLDSTVMAYQQSLDLTQALYETGIDSDESVAQAETQLEATQAQATAVGILRAQYEHAIALLVGQSASTFEVPTQLLNPTPQAIPYGVPSQLLERRPDIAASERLMAQANAQIGVARAAYYPTVTLSAAAGFASTSFTSWFTWPSRLWSVGPGVSETVFDGGLRRATVQQYRAAYDQATANYRETVLTAFQQIEDNLASLRLLSKEIEQQETAVKSAQRNLTLATDRYRLGIDPYLNVITAQTTLLSNQQTDVNLHVLQMTATVQLIEALGGGWDNSQLPSPQSIAAKTP